jgi:hypothetical protein
MDIVIVTVENIIPLGNSDGFYEPRPTDRVIYGYSRLTPELEIKSYIG